MLLPSYDLSDGIHPGQTFGDWLLLLPRAPDPLPCTFFRPLPMLSLTYLFFIFPLFSRGSRRSLTATKPPKIHFVFLPSPRLPDSMVKQPGRAKLFSHPCNSLAILQTIPHVPGLGGVSSWLLFPPLNELGLVPFFGSFCFAGSFKGLDRRFLSCRTRPSSPATFEVLGKPLSRGPVPPLLALSPGPNSRTALPPGDPFSLMISFLTFRSFQHSAAISSPSTFCLF